ncbi:HNH endonuclease, partial [Paenibacillus larvae]
QMSYAKRHGSFYITGGGELMAQSFYKTTRWKQKRSKILRRDEYLCQECKRYGKSVLATTVHHINPLEQQPGLATVSWNLVSLCQQCHDKMHDRTTNVLTELGKQWQERIRDRVGVSKSTDMNGHLSSYAVIMSRDADEQAKAEYFKTLKEANKCFEDANKEFDNVYLYQMVQCSETVSPLP